MSVSTQSAPHGALIFCRVIDNFGDAGVTWRLAKRLRDLGFPTMLVIDSLDTLSKLVPALDPTCLLSIVRDICIVDWDYYEKALLNGMDERIAAPLPNLVLETFGCRLPEVVEKAMCDDLKRLYMNLDYLSAEEWVESSHNIWGLHPSLPIKKLWFFPGFTDKTGGLLIEDDLESRRLAFNKEAFFKDMGALPNRLTLYFFAYPKNAIDALATAIRAANLSFNLILAPGEASDMLATALEYAPNVHLIRAPFVSQEDFDQFMWAADAVIIRGEDSFVRAQLAGTPILWAIYPTEDKAHEIKLDAWLSRFESMYDESDVAAREAMDVCARHWVTGDLTPAMLQTWLDALPAQKEAAIKWQQSILRRGDLARHIVALV